MFYTKSELYEGNRNGMPLDPGLYDISMKHHFGGGIQAPATPAPPQQTNATIASVGDSIRRPDFSSSRVDNKLNAVFTARLRI